MYVLRRDGRWYFGSGLVFLFRFFRFSVLNLYEPKSEPNLFGSVYIYFDSVLFRFNNFGFSVLSSFK